MNRKRYFIAGFAVFISFQILDYIVHTIILAGAYSALTDVWRQDMASLTWMMPVLSLIFSFFITYIFIKGYEDRGILEGIRFGIIIFIVTQGLGVFYEYAVYPLPFSIIAQWFLYGLVEFIIAGCLLSLIYKEWAPTEDIEGLEK